MPKVLFITEVSPFPTVGGERLRSRYILECLDELGCETTALVMNKDSYDLSATQFAHVRLSPWPALDSSPGRTVLKYVTPDRGLLAMIEGQLRHGDIDVAFIDCGFYGQYIQPLKSLGLKVIYGTHNAQADLTRQTPARSPLHGLKIRAAAALQRWHEERFFKAADHVIVVSEEDLEYHAAMMPREKLIVLPNFLNLDDYRLEVAKENQVVMSGNFRSYQNRHGAQWLLDEVWNESLAEKVELVLVGKGSDEAFGRYHGQRGIRVLGAVDEIKPMIASSLISLVPLLHGSGTRLKCLEAMAIGTPVVSTEQGAEGIVHDGAIAIADTPSAFRSEIAALLDDPNLRQERATRAKQAMEERYSSTVAKHILSQLLGSGDPGLTAEAAA